MPDPTPLARVGAALFGSRWQTDLAGALGVSSRTVRRWLAQPETMPPSVPGDLRALAERRIEEIRDAVA